MKLKCVFAFVVSLAAWHSALAQHIEFVVKNPSGKSLPGALLLRMNSIVAISDTNGTFRLNSKPYNFRVHLMGYRDTIVSSNLVNKQVVMQPKDEPALAMKLDKSINYNISNYEKYPDFNSFSTDATSATDSVVEKVAQVSVKWPCIVGTFKLRVSSFYRKYYEDFELSLYKDTAGRPGASLLPQKILAHFYNGNMVFALFDYQLFLVPGSYFIGYKKKVHHKLVESEDNNFLPNLVDYKSTGNDVAFRKINNTVWVPILTPKSTDKKPKYYSFAYSLQLVATENLD